MIFFLVHSFFHNIKEGFWDYYDRIKAKIDKYSVDARIYGNDIFIIKSLEKQKKELEDIMGQYVFFRFCEKVSTYLTQIDMVILFCISISLSLIHI